MQSRIKCLLVDDLEDNLVALAALLRREDVEILTARSGAQALELMLVHDVALALLDVHMPDMDGFELAELIRGTERTRHVPLIFITAGVRDQGRMFKGYETGAVDFLYKPVDPHVLLNKAEVFFQLHRQKLQLAEDLRERTETLRLNEMFVAILGHDLRNPINAILMSANLIERLSGNEDVRKASTRITSSGKRMSRMLEDVLDLARARLAGGLQIRPEDSDLGPVVRRVVQEHQLAFPASRIELQLRGDLAGCWDVDRLAQVISNLASNAQQHGQAGEPIVIEVDGSHPDTVSFSVTNAGTIAPEVLPHIFDPFRGGQQQRGRGDGLGLGLYIVEHIVKSHHGRIEVQSGDDARTTFRVQIPRRGVTAVALTEQSRRLGGAG